MSKEKLTKKGHFEYYIGDLQFDYSEIAKAIVEDLVNNMASAVSFSDYVREKKAEALSAFYSTKSYHNARGIRISLKKDEVPDYYDERGYTNYYIRFDFELPLTEKEIASTRKRKETMKMKSLTKKEKEEAEEKRLLAKLQQKYGKK